MLLVQQDSGDAFKCQGFLNEQDLSNEISGIPSNMQLGIRRWNTGLGNKLCITGIGHVSRSSGLAKTILQAGVAKTSLQGTVKGGRRQGRERKRWEDNIREWTDLEFAKSQRAVENREKWRKLVAKSSVVPQWPSRLRHRWDEMVLTDLRCRDCLAQSEVLLRFKVTEPDLIHALLGIHC